MASIRAKQLKKGARPLLTSDENKEVVMSLREIAAGLVKPGNDTPATPVEAAATQAPAAGDATEEAAEAGEVEASADSGTEPNTEG